MQSSAKHVEEYLDSLPDDRRNAIETVRNVILANLDQDLEEGMQYGMIGYYVPHRIYPAGYHCDPRQPLPYAGLASQKNHMAIYMMTIYSEPAHLAWFESAWKATGKKLDMGKSCIRFKKLEDVALGVIGEAFKRFPASAYIANYERILKRPDRGGTKRVSAAAPKSAGPAKSARKTAAPSASKKAAPKPATSSARTSAKKSAKSPTAKSSPKTAKKPAKKLAKQSAKKTAARRK